MMELGLLFSAVEKQNNPPPKKPKTIHWVFIWIL